jgi:hypothetical protein
MMALMPALTEEMAMVLRNPACKLKCAGSMPTEANPVMTPLAAPPMAAVSMPLIQISKRIIFLSTTLIVIFYRGVRTDTFERFLNYRI